jgi:hypothetical protein
LFVLIGVVGMTTVEKEDGEDYQTRVSYGLAAVRERKVCVVDGYWMHTIRMTLTEAPDGLDVSLDFSAPICVESCARITGLPKASRTLVESMQESISTMVDRIFDLVPDIRNPTSRNRTPRPQGGLLDFVGNVSSFLFEVATETDIESLKKAIKKIEAMEETAVADSSRSRQELASVTRLQFERYENLRGCCRKSTNQTERYSENQQRGRARPKCSLKP